MIGRQERFVHASIRPDSTVAVPAMGLGVLSDCWSSPKLLIS